jgi:hypothetical protein
MHRLDQRINHFRKMDTRVKPRHDEEEHSILAVTTIPDSC